MRLWHKELIDVLPGPQLVSQWRELSAIRGSVSNWGTPNHLLVNKVLDYPYVDFYSYSYYVSKELRVRHYTVSNSVELKLSIPWKNESNISLLAIKDVYSGWHTDRYLIQCYYNLQEKYDCGGIDEISWRKLNEFIWRRCK